MKAAIESVLAVVVAAVAGVMFWVAYWRDWHVRDMVLFGVLWILSAVRIEADRIQRGV